MMKWISWFGLRRAKHYGPPPFNVIELLLSSVQIHALIDCRQMASYGLIYVFLYINECYCLIYNKLYHIYFNYSY